MWFPTAKHFEGAEFQREELVYYIRWARRGTLILAFLVVLTALVTLGLIFRPWGLSPHPAQEGALDASAQLALPASGHALAVRDAPPALTVPEVLPELNWEAEQKARGKRASERARKKARERKRKRERRRTRERERERERGSYEVHLG